MEAGLLHGCRHVWVAQPEDQQEAYCAKISASCQRAPVLRQGCEEDLSLFLEEADHFLLSEKPRKKRRHLKNE